MTTMANGRYSCRKLDLIKTVSTKSTSCLVLVSLVVLFSLVRPSDSQPPKRAVGRLTVLNDDNWSRMLEGEWMVEFFAPWCPACKSLEPEWRTFSGWSQDLGINVAAIDVTENPALSGRFMITALPTIYHVRDGIFRIYRGNRDSNSFVAFVEDKKWNDLEPVSKWTAPDTVQMTVVSHFFRISMTLRAVHNQLIEDYGIPYWASYILFAFGTIAIGAILGLIIVFCIDMIFPAKQVPYSVAKKNDSADSDIIDDSNKEEPEPEADSAGDASGAENEGGRGIRRRPRREN